MVGEWQDIPSGQIRHGETAWGGKAGPSRYTEFRYPGGFSRMVGHLSSQEARVQLFNVRKRCKEMER